MSYVFFLRVCISLKLGFHKIFLNLIKFTLLQSIQRSCFILMDCWHWLRYRSFFGLGGSLILFELSQRASGLYMLLLKLFSLLFGLVLSIFSFYDLFLCFILLKLIEPVPLYRFGLNCFLLFRQLLCCFLSILFCLLCLFFLPIKLFLLSDPLFCFIFKFLLEGLCLLQFDHGGNLCRFFDLNLSLKILLCHLFSLLHELKPFSFFLCSFSLGLLSE